MILPVEMSESLYRGLAARSSRGRCAAN